MHMKVFGEICATMNKQMNYSSVYSETTFQEDSYSKYAIAQVELLYNFVKPERAT